jgi:hypothetical protein
VETSGPAGSTWTSGGLANRHSQQVVDLNNEADDDKREGQAAPARPGLLPCPDWHGGGDQRGDGERERQVDGVNSQTMRPSPARTIEASSYRLGLTLILAGLVNIPPPSVAWR